MASQLVPDKRARDKPCIRCGYSLRYISDARHCPECGLAIWISLSGTDTLDRFHPGWFVRVAIGSAAVAFSQAVALVTTLTWWFSDIALRWLMHLPIRPVFISVFLISLYLLLVGSAMLLFAARHDALPEEIKGWRVLCRFAGASALLVGAIFTVCSFQPFWRYMWLWNLYSTWRWSSSIALVASSAAALAYARQLAILLRRRALMHTCEALLTVCGLMVVFAVPGISQVFLSGLHQIIRYVAAGFFPVSCALFLWLAWIFRNTASEARKLWECESAE